MTGKRELARRLEQVGGRIDELARRAMAVHPDTRSRVERRVDALREREAVVRRDLRMGTEDEANSSGGRLDRLIDEMDIDLAIADSQLEADVATEGAAFQAAVRRQIDAYNAYVERILAEAPPPRPAPASELDAVATSVRACKVAAAERLSHYGKASAAASRTLRLEVLAALDDLDRAVEVVRVRDTRQEPSR